MFSFHGKLQVNRVDSEIAVLQFEDVLKTFLFLFSFISSFFSSFFLSFLLCIPLLRNL